VIRWIVASGAGHSTELIVAHVAAEPGNLVGPSRRRIDGTMAGSADFLR
jgi:hypothetical protein